LSPLACASAATPPADESIKPAARELIEAWR
jgi:hypothetical protein